MTKAIYPGSFDPLTFGHLDIIERAASLMDELTVLLLDNSSKKSLFSIEERDSMIKEVIRDRNLNNVVVDTNSGLLIDYAKDKQINIVIRGLRAITDYEYELQIAQVNKAQYNNLETVFLLSSLNYSYLSSSVVKEFASYGSDISKFVPKSVERLVKEKYNNKE